MVGNQRQPLRRVADLFIVQNNGPKVMFTYILTGHVSFKPGVARAWGRKLSNASNNAKLKNAYFYMDVGGAHHLILGEDGSLVGEEEGGYLSPASFCCEPRIET